MKTQWFAGMKPAEAEVFKQNLIQSKKVLDKLSEIVYNMVKDRREVSVKDYDSPSWSHRQAHTNGAEEMGRKIIDLLDLGLPTH